HLRAAREGLPDPRARSMAAFRWGYIETVAGDSDAAAALMRTAAAELDGATDPALVDLRQRLTALELYSCWFGSTDSTAHGRLEAHDYGREDDSAGGQMLLAVEAFNRACRGESAERVAAVARAAVTGAVLGGVEYEIRDVMAFLSLSAADSPEADALLERIIADSHRRGSRFSAASARMWHGELMIRRGELQDAIGECRAAIDDFGEWSRRMTPLRLSAYLATALTERGEHADGHAVIDRCTDLGRGQSGTLVTVARARLALAEGDAAGAIAAADTAAARCGTQVVNPAIAPWRSLKAQALDRLGDPQAALELAHQELTLARRWGAPAEIGLALRVLGTLERSEGIDRLREAVDVLTGSRARLELAKALAALGGALRRDRRPSEAREPLRMALELADACGAVPLAAHVRTELHATGARPRTEALSGVGALTASERRVVDLAVEGHTNRDIAQSLFVTPKTVEVHLTNVYRKLGISSRRDLAGAVAAG
ncbi:MAG: hypothetical protein QOJ07_3394, partial [Thermoleophilaceae bacterium]|nr:hypothetical protein [Thermoleophilaceae bacterium]